MILYLLQFEFLLKYLRDFENLRFLLLRDLLYYHGGELILRKIVFTPILKPHQEPLLLQDSLHHTSHVLPHNSQTSCPYILLQITYLGFYYRPHHDLVSPPPSIFLCGEVILRRNNKFWGVCGELIVLLVGSAWASGCLFMCFEEITNKKGLHMNLLLTYDWKFC